MEPRSLEVIEGWLGQRRRLWERTLDRLGEFLERIKRKGKEIMKYSKISSRELYDRKNIQCFG